MTVRAALLALSASAFIAAPAAAEPTALRDLLTRNSVVWAKQAVALERMRAGYEARGFAPIWTQGNGLSAAGTDLVNQLARAYEDGLDPTDYLNRISGFTEASGPTDLAKLELAMTDVFLEMGQDLYSGVTTPSVTAKDIVIRKKKVNWARWMARVDSDGVKATYKALRPDHPQYASLRQMLQGYRTLMIKGGWQSISAGGATLKPGVSDQRVVQIRQNLRARGYDQVAQSAAPSVYDDGVVEAVRHFQERHGLTADGFAGGKTIKAMNISASQRVKQLAVNLERWRWLPRDLGDKHVLVNQAAFELFMMRGREIVDNRRVIVGKPYHKTPMFSDEIIYAEFNPTWTIPKSILGKEMLPKIRKNPQYLNDKGYSLYTSWKAKAKPISPFSVDWSKVSPKRFPYRVVQGPGPKNALGQVKFIFPNDFAVYMHDTPSRNLFSRTGRAFSHGCIRVHRPVDFAQKVFALNGGMDPARIPGLLDSKKTKRVNLKTKLPVHLAYFTTWVNEAGVPQFYDDVYERDRMVARFMF